MTLISSEKVTVNLKMNLKVNEDGKSGKGEIMCCIVVKDLYYFRGDIVRSIIL